jgi:predicted NBD/HSP70 family sugar kinase
LVRAINLRATFELIRVSGPLGASQVVRGTGLSRPTVAEVLSQLLSLNLIRKAGRTQGLPGPSAQLYSVNPRAGWVLSLDIGREWIRAGLIDLTGATVGRSAWPTTLPTASVLVTLLREVAERLTAEAGISLNQVEQVVVGTPGLVRAGEDHFFLTPQLPGLESASVIAEIRQALVAPVVFENDANLAALAEHEQGVAQGAEDFVLVFIGSGVGMGVVLDGELRHGAGGLAGEIGYLPLATNATESGHSVWGAGAFEAMVSSAGILALASDRGLADADSVAHVVAAARAGDETARNVIATVGLHLARGIAAIAAVLDPELVVLGGGIGSGGGDLLLPHVASELTAISPFSPRLAISTLGSEAVVAGASALGLRLAIDRIFEEVAGLPPEVRRARPGFEPTPAGSPAPTPGPPPAIGNGSARE